MGLLRDVYVVGGGISHFGVHPEKSSRELFSDAFLACCESVDKGIDPKKDIEGLFFGAGMPEVFEKQGHVGPMMADVAGIIPVPTVRTEGACASGSLAFRMGVFCVASGASETVLIGGAEKMHDLTTAEVTDALAYALDILLEKSAGLTFPGIYATMATIYRHKYGIADDDYRGFQETAIKSHANAALNDYAQMPITVEGLMQKAIKRGKGTWNDVYEYLNDTSVNFPVAHPMRLMDCSLVTDGGAACIITSNPSKFTDSPIKVLGSGGGSTHMCLHQRPEPTLGSAVEAARQAFNMAKKTPKDIHLAEVHDCFTIAELIALEDLGFYKRGKAWQATIEGETRRDGSIPINTSGGLKSKGHPIGASGIGQIVEIYQQLLGKSGERQVQGAEVGLAHNVGGSGGTAVVHILERA
ncbi:MAG: hypothetical protein ACFFCZ_26005 [Promethearchaeota archaeon]